MDPFQLAKMSYGIAHSEVDNRVRQRDNVLLVFLAASGTIFGVSLGTAKANEMLLVIPILALGCSILVAHHSLIIGMVYEYCYFELDQFLSTGNPSNNPPIIERSLAWERNREGTIRLRSVGHSIILGAPCVVAMLFNWSHSYNFSMPATGGWWLGMLCTMLSIIVMLKMNRDRIRSFQAAKVREQKRRLTGLE
jgi:hypothetical protein